MKHCPNCHSMALKPCKIEYGLPGVSCTQCHGVLINLLSYRQWAESKVKENPQPITPLDVIVDNNSKALQCPKCQHLMNKFRIATEVNNQVDVCLHCDEAWLDEGEWVLLKHLELQNKLATITTEPWQIRVKNEQAHQAVEKSLIERVGEESYHKAAEFGSWLKLHPQKNVLLRIIREKSEN